MLTIRIAPWRGLGELRIGFSKLDERRSKSPAYVALRAIIECSRPDDGVCTVEIDKRIVTSVRYGTDASPLEKKAKNIVKEIVQYHRRYNVGISDLVLRLLNHLDH